MVEFILYSFGLVLCILGLAEVLHSVKLFLVTSRQKRLTYSVIILSNNNYSQQLRYVYEQHRWLGKKYADYIIAINDFLDVSNRDSALQKAKANGIIVCSFKELESVVLYFNKGRLL